MAKSKATETTSTAIDNMVTILGKVTIAEFAKVGEYASRAGRGTKAWHIIENAMLVRHGITSATLHRAQALAIGQTTNDLAPHTPWLRTKSDRWPYIDLQSVGNGVYKMVNKPTTNQQKASMAVIVRLPKTALAALDTCYIELKASKPVQATTKTASTAKAKGQVTGKAPTLVCTCHTTIADVHGEQCPLYVPVSLRIAALQADSTDTPAEVPTTA